MLTLSLSDIFCCFHSIHNSQSLDHKLLIKNSYFGHFYFLSANSLIQRILSWKFEGWIIICLDLGQNLHKNATLCKYNYVKNYNWITLSLWMLFYNYDVIFMIVISIVWLSIQILTCKSKYQMKSFVLKNHRNLAYLWKLCKNRLSWRNHHSNLLFRILLCTKRSY